MAASDFLGTLGGKIVLGVVGVVLTLAITGVSLYASDYAVEATVVEKQCAGLGPGTVTVQEKVTRLTHTQEIGGTECNVVQRGNFVLYNIQSERTRVFRVEGGELLWDSAWTSQSGGGSFPLAVDDASR